MAQTRLEVLRFPCPTCKVKAGEVCRRTTDDPRGDGTRFQFHSDRRTFARLSHRERELKVELALVRSNLRLLGDAADSPLPPPFKHEPVDL